MTLLLLLFLALAPLLVVVAILWGVSRPEPNFRSVISEAVVLENLGQSHEHIREQARCEQPRAESGVPELRSDRNPICLNYNKP